MEDTERLEELERLAEDLKQTLLRQKKKHKMDQDRIAVNTKFDPAYISKFMNKKCKNPKVESLVELAWAFNCRVKISFVPKTSAYAK